MPVRYTSFDMCFRQGTEHNKGLQQCRPLLPRVGGKPTVHVQPRDGFSYLPPGPRSVVRETTAQKRRPFLAPARTAMRAVSSPVHR